MPAPRSVIKASIALVFSILACSSLLSAPTPAAVPVTPPLVTPLGLATASSLEPQFGATSGQSTGRSQQLVELLSAVSSDNLMDQVNELSAVHSRHVNSQTIQQAANIIFDGFASAGGNWQVTFDEFPLAFNGLQTIQRNVVATLPGSDPSAGTILVGAHYDSRSVDFTDAVSRAPGADDNASGVAALIEMARVLAGADTPPRATIVLVAFSAEEVGIEGSQHYVQTALQRGDDLRTVLALDIIGNAGGQRGEGSIRVFSAQPNDSPSRQLARYIDLLGDSYMPGFDVLVQSTVDRPARYSDHVPFSNAGIPSARLIETIENSALQHNQFDLPQNISPGYFRQSTQLAMTTVVNLAYGPSAPQAPRHLPDQLESIVWTPVEGASGYLLAFRSTDQLEFSTTIRISDAATSLTWAELATGRFSFVTVAAIDSNGFLGLPSPELKLNP